MPYHVRAEPGDVARSVLCPGDPRRAAYIAATFFDPGYRQVNDERGMLGFTGTFEGRPITVQSPAWASGLCYDPDLTNIPRWARLGHRSLEMEAAMLYTVAAVHRVEALAMMTVSDILGATEDERERISDEQLRQGVDDMIRVACRVATTEG